MTTIENMPDYIAITKKWVEVVVIGHNFCPFAKKEIDLGRVEFVLDHADDTEACLLELIYQCKRLDENPDIETSLIIYSESLRSFDDFIDYAEMAQELLTLQGYEGVYQLASFHPEYCFEGEDENDPANYTNRSPCPMLHLIREKSIENVLKSYPAPETIPENNIKLAREKGLDYFKALLISIASQ